MKCCKCGTFIPTNEREWAYPALLEYANKNSICEDCFQKQESRERNKKLLLILLSILFILFILLNH